MEQKVRVALLCGGQSAEHEVSLQSAKNVAEAVDTAQYEKTLIGITKDGRWLWREQGPESGVRGFLRNGNDPKTICLDEKNLVPFDYRRLRPLFDVVFPVLHGPFGEDGAVQGLLKMSGVPFVGSGILGSALGMDKAVAKKLLRAEGIPIANFITLHKGEPVPSFAAVAEKLGSPLFVKPANMGSSVGVHKIHGADEWEQSLGDAFRYDTKIIIEEFIEGREIECAVLGNGVQAEASCAGEIIASHEFYSYDAKYIDESGARIVIPADLPYETMAAIRKTAVQTFVTLCCSDLSRVDFFLKKDGQLIVNEINTMPGFTEISMYPKLWEQCGIPYQALVSRLISYALNRS
jgi:D-alanine-D-alanine ligase